MLLHRCSKADLHYDDAAPLEARSVGALDAVGGDDGDHTSAMLVAVCQAGVGPKLPPLQLLDQHRHRHRHQGSGQTSSHHSHASDDDAASVDPMPRVSLHGVGVGAPSCADATGARAA